MESSKSCRMLEGCVASFILHVRIGWGKCIFCQWKLHSGRGERTAKSINSHQSKHLQRTFELTSWEGHSFLVLVMFNINLFCSNALQSEVLFASWQPMSWHLANAHAASGLFYKITWSIARFARGAWSNRSDNSHLFHFTFSLQDPSSQAIMVVYKSWCHLAAAKSNDLHIDSQLSIQTWSGCDSTPLHFRSHVGQISLICTIFVENSRSINTVEFAKA